MSVKILNTFNAKEGDKTCSIFFELNKSFRRAKFVFLLNKIKHGDKIFILETHIGASDAKIPFARGEKKLVFAP